YGRDDFSGRAAPLKRREARLLPWKPGFWTSEPSGLVGWDEALRSPTTPANPERQRGGSSLTRGSWDHNPVARAPGSPQTRWDFEDSSHPTKAGAARPGRWPTSSRSPRG